MTPTSPEECDVLLRDGGIAHVRPLRDSDRAALHGLVDASSERSTYLRFATGGTATAHAYMDRVTGPRYQGRALVALIRGRLAGIAEYIGDDSTARAELGILIDDRVHGHGLGTVLLEHLALDAAEHGVKELVAEVLAGNTPVIGLLKDAGLAFRRTYADGWVRFEISTATSAELLTMIDAREHEAERNSLARLFAPSSVAVVGAGRDAGGVGHRVLRNLVDGGFPGPLFPVNPKATEVCGLPAHPAIAAVPGPVDLVVVATPAGAVTGVARECAARGVGGLVVVSSGFAEAGNAGQEAELGAVYGSDHVVEVRSFSHMIEPRRWSPAS
ncbi:GNAT family N-acetyltransferase [Sphaerisporangium corydalis]|uniref:GNAT family N-acetyltransferase n=1 Tax=Sphaerisporangium corydalis TaxID=1441875 RepID=A0ABV9EQ76_9ACTN